MSVCNYNYSNDSSVYLKEKAWQVVKFWLWKIREIKQWRKEYKTILNTKLKLVYYSIESHTLQLVCKISANGKEYYYITDMLCDRNMDI